MKKTLIALAVAMSTAAVVADEADDMLTSMAVAATNKVSIKRHFSTLPLCLRIEGTAYVCKPGGEWTEAEEGRYYPFGVSYRAGKNSRLVVQFGVGSTVQIANGSEFATRAQKVGLPSRTLVLRCGTVDLTLADNLPEGAFFVTAPGFTVKNMAGVSSIVYENSGDGDQASVRCVTGLLGVEGPHFDIPAMHAANQVKIRTSSDRLCTFLYGISGDYVVKVDQGVKYREEFDDEGHVRNVEEKRSLDWKLTPSTKIFISRAVPAIGERMSVHTMAFDAAGQLKSECCFSEGRPMVNSGEIIPQKKISEKDIAKRAAEITAEKPEEENASNEEEKKEEE